MSISNNIPENPDNTLAATDSDSVDGSDTSSMDEVEFDGLSFSHFAEKFEMTSFEANSAQWNKDWEQVLKNLTATDMYETLFPVWKRIAANPSELAERSQEMKSTVSKMQDLLSRLWEQMEEDEHFRTVWLLLEESERKRHLWEGLNQACRAASFGQDGRAMCPEITIRSMMKSQGRTFLDFISAYYAGTKDQGDENVYCLPSEWWDIPLDANSKLLPEEHKLIVLALTLQRNEFISEFLIFFAAVI